MPEDDLHLAEKFAAFAAHFHAEPGTERTVASVAEYARDALGCTDAGVLVRKGGVIETAAATSARVEKSDQIQRELGEGPCFAASETAELFRVDDTKAVTPWPEWAWTVSQLGIRSALGVPLRTHDRNYGALNLYAEEPGAFGDDEVAIAMIFARHAAIALDNATKEQTLAEAIDARKIIGQAQGIIMERYHVNEDTAFDTLRRFSQDNNLKLRLVAEHIVSEREFPSLSADS
jgi:GAF domain-containing protein